ncbi:MAG: hypothetical protein EOO38_02665 [Cytophagaceae bacterium]|nr:MAG: hypothetical protein EOO38_02665 [Cytophagaceae bacterium]
MRTTTAEFSTAAKEDTLNHHHASTFEDIEFADMVTLKSERVKKALRVLGVTPFHKPELDGSEEHVRSLLNGRARVTAALGVLATAPMSSAELSRDSPCAILLKKERSNFRLARLTSEATPLFVACAKGHSACARALLVADTSAVDMRLNRWTPFHIACLFGHNACLEALLLKRHAILDAHDEDGWTPFHIACANGRIACVQALLEAGANKDAMTNDGWRPLHVACIFGHDACVRALLDAEANKEAADNNGWTPLHTACANGHAACARTLLNSLVTKDAVDAFGRTPLFLATVMSCEAIVRILLQMGASVYVGTRSGCNPLSIARSGGNAIIESLLAEAEAEQTPPVPNAIAVVPTRTALSSTISPIELPLTPPAGTSLTSVVVPQLLYSELIFDSEAGGAQIELGRGSFGNVYAGRWKGERVAIKKMSMPLELVASGRFRREVELHMRANSKYVVLVYGAAVRPVRDITDKMTCYVVMDRMPSDLSCALFGSFATDHPAYNIAATARLLPQRLRLLLEIARGVRFLHAHNIVHADLKPGNVMLDHDGHAKLTDFGLAVQRKIDASRTRSSQIGMRGSLPYMDPALFYENMSVKPSSDMYSWGVLAWEVLTLRKPYENTIRNLGSAVLAAGAGLTASTDAASPLSGPTMPSMNRRTFSGDRPHDVLARVPDVPPGLRALIVRCWSEDQSARPTAEDAIAVLEPLVEG